MDAAVAAAREVDRLPGPGERHVEQPPLLLELIGRLLATAREEPFLESGDDDPVELQALRIVHGDQRHPVGGVAGFLLAGAVELDALEKLDEPLGRARIERGGVEELLEVLKLLRPCDLVLFGVIVGKAGLVDGGIEKRHKVLPAEGGLHAVDCRGKGRYRVAGAGTQAGGGNAQGLAQVPAGLSRGGNELLERGRADPARRLVHDAAKAHLVPRIREELEHRDSILHLLALVEAQRPHDAVGDALAQKDRLEEP